MTVGELCDDLAEAHIQRPNKKPRSWTADRQASDIHIKHGVGSGEGLR